MKSVLSQKRILIALIMVSAVQTIAIQARDRGYLTFKEDSAQKRSFANAIAYMQKKTNSDDQVNNYLSRNKSLLALKSQIGYTLLMEASRLGRLSVVTYIIKEGTHQGIKPSVAVNQVQAPDHTALSYAAGRGKADVVKYLMTLKPSQGTLDGAYTQAMSLGRMDIVDLLGYGEGFPRRSQN